MSTQRLIWILWCVGWASFWFIFSAGLLFPLSILSLLCIFFPVGKSVKGE